MRNRAYSKSTILFLAGQVICAASTIVPPGLTAGSEFRLIFVTSTTTLPTSTDIAYYNSFVTNAANNVPGSVVAFLGAQWYAVASTPFTDAATNIGGMSQVPIYNLNPAGDQLVANGADLGFGGLWGGVISNKISYDETKTSVSSFTWTGTLILGGTATALGTPNATNGDTTSYLSAWIENDNGDTSVALPLYAISPDLIVLPGGGVALAGSTPEPGAFSLMALGVFVAAVIGKRKQSRLGP